MTIGCEVMPPNTPGAVMSKVQASERLPTVSLEMVESTAFRVDDRSPWGTGQCPDCCWVSGGTVGSGGAGDGDAPCASVMPDATGVRQRARMTPATAVDRDLGMDLLPPSRTCAAPPGAEHDPPDRRP